jgi:hypothetical protein
MRLALFFAGVFLLCMPSWLARLLRRLESREGVSVALGAVLAGSAAIELALILVALPHSTASLHDGPVVVHCGPLVLPGRSLIQVTAAFAAVALPALALRAWRKSRAELQQARVGGESGVHTKFRGVDVACLPSSAIAAYSIGGRDPQIVISDGLVALLEPAELQAVLAHELAHVQEHHGTTLRLLAALEAALPPIRRTVSTLRLMLERRADEEAVGASPDRRATLLDALLKVADVHSQPALAAFAHRSGVVERAEALLAEPCATSRAHRITDRLALTGATTGGVAGVGVAIIGIRVLLSLIGVCCGA